MKAFVTLLRREWLEAKVPFFWLPLGTLSFIVIVSLVALAVSGFSEMHIYMNSDTSDQQSLSLFFPDQWSDREFEERMSLFRTIATTPFYLIYVASSVFILLGALYDERKDRSVLFWKSMPVNDYQSVLSKLFLVVGIAPLVMLVFATLAQIFLLVLITIWVATQGLGDASGFWWHSGFLTGTFKLLLGFAIQGLWTLPITSYLLLISATVPRLTFLWALLVPIGPALAESMVFRTDVISSGISRHMEPAALPNFLHDGDRIMPIVTTVADQLALLLTADLWIGVLIGAAFLYGAVRMRGFKNEI